MAQVKKTVLVGFSAAQMYHLVDAVEQYPQFLPWCGGTELLERTTDKTIARLHIAYHGIKQDFSTENTKQFPHTMRIALKDGPFKRLDGYWHFIELAANACKIEFELNYDFSNAFFDRLISPVFGHIANTFVDAFVKRAEDIYGG